MLIRYPGSKEKVKSHILNKLIDLKTKNGLTTYIEPFFGAGSIGFSMFTRMQNNSINDYDPAIFSLWLSVKFSSKPLKDKVSQYTPDISDFYQFKTDLLNIQPGTDYDFLDTGFKKLVLHQISYSGLGPKSGSPLGGNNQSSKYKIDCRWSPKTLCKNIDKANKLLQDTWIGRMDCIKYMEMYTDPSLTYIDPPYVDKGNELYQYGFSIEDHIRLAEYLKNSNHHWVLSYDDCEFIRQLYAWANIEELTLTYSINGSREKKELLITRK